MDVPDIYDPSEYKAYSKDIEYDMEKFKDPYVVGAMIHRLVEERKYTNAILKSILEKLDEIKTEQPQKHETVLSEIEEHILQLVKQKGKTDAEEIQRELGYKGRNGASAKLNALHKKGLLEKRRAGKKVYFLSI